MIIKTNLGVNFGSFKDLLRYMKEESITEVEVITDYWGATLPKNKLTISEVEKIIKGE